MHAVAVFHDFGFGFGWWARFLRPGFRHCFVVFDAGGFWIIIDGKAGVPEVRVVAATDFDLPAWYRGEGFTVIETETTGAPWRQPVMLATCVGATKRLLGIRAPFVLTPWQLFRRLGAADRPGA